MKKILIMVLSSQSDHHDCVKSSQHTWDSVYVDGVETLFYYGKSAPRQNLDALPRLLFIDINDPDWGRKNLMAFDWALKNKSWDYMVRVNGSCYLRKQKLFDLVQTLPDTGMFHGVLVEHSGFKFMCGGAPFIMSRDVVERIVSNGDQWNHALPEDVAISKLAEDIGISLNPGGYFCAIYPTPEGWSVVTQGSIEGITPAFSFQDFSQAHQFKEHYAIRVKQAEDRLRDNYVREQLIKAGI